VDVTRFGKIRQGEIFLRWVDAAVGEVKPEGVVTGEAVAATAAEDDVEGTKFFGNGGGPPEEDVGDDEELAVFVLYEDAA